MFKQGQGLLLVLLATVGLYGQSEYRFSDGGRLIAYRLAEDEVFSRGGRGLPSSRSDIRSDIGSDIRSEIEWGSGRLAKLTGSSSVRQLARASWAQDRTALAPVFYDTQDLPSVQRLASLPESDRLSRLASARRVMTGRLHVHLDLAQSGLLTAPRPVSVETSLVKGWLIATYADPMTALSAAEGLISRGELEFSPVFSRVMGKKQVLRRLITDALYPKQWHLQSEAFHLNMQASWDEVTGKGINMTVVDDGLDVRHEDLSPTCHALETGFHRNFNDGDDKADPSPRKASENHGTACAGLAGAAGFNEIGVIGIAPEVKMMGLRLIAGDSAEDDNGTAMAWQPEGIVTHVSSNSWGPADDGKSAGRVSALQIAGMEKAATGYREGLGTVFLIAAGNGRDSGDNGSYDEFSSSRFGIAVGAVNRSGKQSSYSENGLGVAISAFGGEFEQPDVMWTTNNSGDEALAIKTEKFPTSLAPIHYTDSFNGTSAATPQVAGAVALLLEKNPKLSYRDVKEILMKSATRENLAGQDPFVENKGGFFFSHSFGAGLLHVTAALKLASTWSSLGPLVSAGGESTEALAIPDDGSLVTRDIALPDAKIRVEHVEFTFTIKHANRGDISVGIVSPGGTIAEASPRPNDDGADFVDYKMTTPRFWGEPAAGAWKFAAFDAKKNDITGELVKVEIKVFGTAQ